MSIVRVGLAETKNYAEGYEAIFGGRKQEKATKPAKAVKMKASKAKKKKPGKKRK